MPNIADIIEVAEELEDKAVVPASKRCVAVRNRNASCRKCIDACPADAISVHNNVLSVDHKACVACGACTVVCPTEALIPVRPADEALEQAAAEAMASLDGRAVIACARIASKGLADPHKFAEAPCLARVDESLLLGLAAVGAKDIVLVDGCCKTCRFRETSPGVDETIASANSLMQAQGAPAMVSPRVGVPRRVGAQEREKPARRGAPRLLHQRNFVDGQRGGQDRRDGHPQKPRYEGQGRHAARAAGGGTLRARCPSFRSAAAARCSMPWTVWASLRSSRSRRACSGRVEIDASACNSCGMCAVFCPTGPRSSKKPHQAQPRTQTARPMAAASWSSPVPSACNAACAWMRA